MNEDIDVVSILPERVRDVHLYDPLREPITYDLSDNTSQWGMAPGVKEGISEIANELSATLSRYPDIYASTVKRALAKQYGEFLGDQPQKNIVVGAGTDDVLDCIIRALTQSGDTVISPMPTFPMASYFSKYNDRKVIGIELEDDGSIDAEKFLETPSELIYLCTPNNPTGMPIDREKIESLLKSYAGFVVIDEAYAEFANSNFLDLLKINPRVLIMRTFSKLHALAGLRIGYGLGDERVIAAIEALRGPYKANVIAQKAAVDSLAQKTWLSNVASETRSTREWFVAELFKLGFAPLPSDANFVFVPMEVSGKMRDAFLRAGIAVRIFEELPVCGGGIRITIAPREVLQKAIDVLKVNS